MKKLITIITSILALLGLSVQASQKKEIPASPSLIDEMRTKALPLFPYPSNGEAKFYFIGRNGLQAILRKK